MTKLDRVLLTLLSRTVDMYKKGILELEQGILLNFESSDSNAKESKEFSQARKLQHKVDLNKQKNPLKGVFAKNERGYRRNAKIKRFRSLLILLLSVASIRRKLLKTIHTEE